jgi:hypothetical protein
LRQVLKQPSLCETLSVGVADRIAKAALTRFNRYLSYGQSGIVQVVKGRLEFIADGEQLDAGPGFWLHMEPGTPHSLTAREPTVMLLTLIDAG